MAIYFFEAEQDFPSASLEELWDYISSPANLSKITPPEMGFEVLSQPPKEMYTGLTISYTVKPLLSIKMSWLTEITHVKHHSYFVDEQRVGPYKVWHHEHFLEQHEGFVRMKDRITYVPPFGVLGAIANRLIIRKSLRDIFTYRKLAMVQKFGV
jgi:ligand-binding SRPBCC domain-containing protein